MKKPLIVDSHEDLAWNMLCFDRDYTLASKQIREKEKNSIAPEVNGDTMLGWDDYQKAGVGLIFGTLFSAPIRAKEGEWDILTYRDQKEARQQYLMQLDAYQKLLDEHSDRFRSITSMADLRMLLEERKRMEENPSDALPSLPIGLVYLMEGADAITAPEKLSEWVERGVTLIGPAWHGTAYCGGTREPGGLTSAGYKLLEIMQNLNCVLDISHMDEKAVFQAFDQFSGRIMASHSNALALLRSRESNRFLSDEVIQLLAERDAVIGMVPYNLFLDPSWNRGDDRNRVSVERFIEQVDYVCQLLGNTDHVGIGTDFDGGFGWQSVPRELNSIADLPMLIPMFEERGYTEQDVEKIFGLNWIRFLQEALPS
jgi:membrane dipeptidase